MKALWWQLWHDWAVFGCIHNSITAESWGNLFPNFLRNHHTDFQSDCTSLYSHQQWRSVPLITCLLQIKLYSVFLILAILTSLVKWNLRVVLICISLRLKTLSICLSGFQAFEIHLLGVLICTHSEVASRHKQRKTNLQSTTPDN